MKIEMFPWQARRNLLSTGNVFTLDFCRPLFRRILFTVSHSYIFAARCVLQFFGNRAFTNIGNFRL
jgi:hypothetical protein